MAPKRKPAHPKTSGGPHSFSQLLKKMASVLDPPSVPRNIPDDSRINSGRITVHPEGVEPPTYGSEDRCSIQLSYGCKKLAYDQLTGIGSGEWNYHFTAPTARYATKNEETGQAVPRLPSLSTRIGPVGQEDTRANRLLRQATARRCCDGLRHRNQKRFRLGRARHRAVRERRGKFPAGMSCRGWEPG